MTGRTGDPMPNELELGLADLAGGLAFPPTPDLAAAVGLRLRTAATNLPAAPGQPEAPRRLPIRLPVRRSFRRSLLLAAALALVVVGAAVAVRFGLELLSIKFGPVPTISPSPIPPGAKGENLGMGQAADLQAAEATATAAGFELLVPDDLGSPDFVYLGDATLRGQIAFVYLPRDDLRASPILGGAAILITQNHGRQDQGLAHKLADTKLATVESVNVDGAPGAWIAGQPHFFWYLAPDGTFIEESRRLVGDTLVWERDGVLYRIEGAITVERALEIARSMR